jgi:hypothetical protein
MNNFSPLSPFAHVTTTFEGPGAEFQIMAPINKGISFQVLRATKEHTTGLKADKSS